MSRDPQTPQRWQRFVEKPREVEAIQHADGSWQVRFLYSDQAQDQGGISDESFRAKYSPSPPLRRETLDKATLQPAFVRAQQDWQPLVQGVAIGLSNALNLDGDGLLCVQDALNRARIAGYVRGVTDSQSSEGNTTVAEYCGDCHRKILGHPLIRFESFAAPEPAPPERWSMTYGDLPDAVRPLIEPHIWDNKNISQQRDWAVQQLAKVVARTPEPPPFTREPSCEWKLDDDGIYQTSCGHSFFFDTDDATANGGKFCFYCGKGLVDVQPAAKERG